MRVVPVNAVTSGSLLGKTLYAENGNILLKAGVALTEGLLDKIRENGFYTIYIQDEYSDEIIEDIIKPELRQKAVQAVKDTFSSIQREQAHLKEVAFDFRKSIKVHKMEKYVSKLNKLAKIIVEDLHSSKPVMINLVDIKNVDNYIYQHSLNVAILALMIGIEEQMSIESLEKLFLGALLHDVGKILIPRSSHFYYEGMEIDNHVHYEEHTEKGYEYLRDHFHLLPTINIIALEHHEHYDGSGFPLGKSGDYINKYARIVAIANCYDEATSDTPHQPALPPNEAIEVIMAKTHQAFDYRYASVFVRKINPYPPGTIVLLSTQEYAVVVGTNINYPMRPIVHLIDTTQKKKKEGGRIDLMQAHNITILKIQFSEPI